MSIGTTNSFPFDVITIGRVGVDLYPVQDSVTLDKVETFSKYLGGSATNVAIAAACHGLKAAVITRTGNDPFGTFIKSELVRLGVSDEYVFSVPNSRTPVVFAELFPPNNFPLYYYREPKAPDLMIEASELDIEAIVNSKIYWSTLTGLSEEPSRGAHHFAWDKRNKKSHTILDLDYRAALWQSPLLARVEIAKALSKVSVVIGNLEECEIATSQTDPERAADAFLDQGVEIAVIKMGPEGVLAKSKYESVRKSPHFVKVANGLGAGDSFGGAFCYGLLQGWDLEKTTTFANVAGAINASRRECATAMPSTQEVESALSEASKE